MNEIFLKLYLPVWRYRELSCAFEHINGGLPSLMSRTLVESIRHHLGLFAIPLAVTGAAFMAYHAIRVGSQ